MARATTILLIEDDPEIRSALVSLLGDCGYAVASAGDGREALEHLRAGARPDLLLLDVMMPVMDGVAFRAAQLADPELSDIPVIVLTAAGRPYEYVRSLRAAAALAKPFDLADLTAAIERVTGERGSPLPAGGTAAA